MQAPRPQNVTMGRSKSKFGQPVGQIRPMTENAHVNRMLGQSDADHERSVFAKLSRCCTFCCWDSCLVTCVDPKEKNIKKCQDWREKVTICIIFGLIMLFVGFFTVFLQQLLCPPSLSLSLGSIPNRDDYFAVFGFGYKVSENNVNIGGSDGVNIDKSPLFSRASFIEALIPGACDGLAGKAAQVPQNERCGIGNNRGTCLSVQQLNPGKPRSDQIQEVVTFQNANKDGFFILNGNFLDMRQYLSENQADPNDPVDRAIRIFTSASKGKDATLFFDRDPDLQKFSNCLAVKFRVAGIEKKSPGCFMATLITVLSLMVVLGIVFARFFMALYYSWIQEPKLIAKRDNNNPPIVILVTCYNEDKEGLKGTFESLTNTHYPSDRKMLFVVCDGIHIKGKNAPAPTSELARSLIQVHEKFKNPLPMDYFSIESGEKQHNRAQIYIGHYTSEKQHSMPVVICVKCGTDKENKNNPRSGNRGKRDSQIILMRFWSHVFYDDRLSPLALQLNK